MSQESHSQFCQRLVMIEETDSTASTYEQKLVKECVDNMFEVTDVSIMSPFVVEEFKTKLTEELLRHVKEARIMVDKFPDKYIPDHMNSARLTSIDRLASSFESMRDGCVKLYLPKLKSNIVTFLVSYQDELICGVL